MQNAFIHILMYSIIMLFIVQNRTIINNKVVESRVFGYFLEFLVATTSGVSPKPTNDRNNDLIKLLLTRFLEEILALIMKTHFRKK